MMTFHGNPVTNKEAAAVLKHAYAQGVTHWDTDNLYRGTDKKGNVVCNETLSGRPWTTRDPPLVIF